MLKLSGHEIEGYLKGKGLQLRRRGQKVEIKRCPFCDGGKHNDLWKFVVYIDNDGGNYKCMRGSCDVSGSFWQLAEHFGDNPKEFYKRENFNAKPLPLQSTERLKPDLSFKSGNTTANDLTPGAIKYLKARGFTDEVLSEVAIWCDEKGLINFGYYHESELCMVKVRKAGKPKPKEVKAWQKWKGGLRTLYGIEQCDFEKYSDIVITFGEYDRIALHQAGIPNCVSVPCGDSDLEWINVCYETLKDCDVIYLWIDNDEAGRKALPKIAARLGASKIKIAKSEYKDANEFLLKETKKHGLEVAHEKLIQTVSGSNWFYKGDLIQFADITPEDPCFEGYKSGLEVIDKTLGGFLYGRLTVHTGDTKAGKSTALNQITAQAVEDGSKVCVWSGEDEITDYRYKMSVHVAGYEGTEEKISRGGAPYSIVKPEYQDKVAEWSRNRLYVLDKRSGVTEDLLLEQFQLAYERFGCDMFVVDNLMKLVAAKDSENIYFRQTQIVNALSDFAKETKTHVHLVTHTSKSDSAKEAPKDLRDVAGAKEIVNLCDSLIAWWRIPAEIRHEYDNADTVCAVLANRVFGTKRSANLFFDARTKRFMTYKEDACIVQYDLD